MQMIVNPSSNLFVCGEFLLASAAFGTEQYVVDIMTTTDARYPVRSIVALQVLTGVSTDTVYSACDELEPQGQWETPGFVLKSSEGAAANSNSSDVIICVQRPLTNATGSFSVLTDLSVVLPTESCVVADSANSTEITSDQIKLCAAWDIVDFGNSSSNTSVSSEATSFFVAELALYVTSEAESAHFNISSTVPGEWGRPAIMSLLAAASIIAQELREESNSTSSVTAGKDNDPLYNKCREALTVAFLDELLDIEQPDFVVFTGDNVQTNLDTSMHAFAMNVFSARGLSRKEMLDLLVEGKQYSHVKYGPRDIGGVGNYEVNVVAPTTGPWGEQGSTVFRMYFMDSHVTIDTTAYRSTDKSHAPEGAAGGVPAVMFYHIPVPEYAMASPLNRNGDEKEVVASAEVNSGLFSALVEMGDVKATFVGHDHVNEYCYFRQGVQLCYGGGIGLGRAYGLPGFERRARVLEWTYNVNRTRTLQSWKRHFDDPTQIQSLELLYSE
ncbi:uncharacterized protein PITG_03980 [Phytophthora infestans T30-4]|uniref:Calcineurin-like phosphoesterase domain-containing protein n=1 Tax=Phytophthora infestans (strain T30-4) TaxID=403677 RepID=D0MZ12_PHYIT|nr:uncharacterized protein PITG_03980 [Phytophthora infestans T30-4]EEY66410.1 conserved hypothetical protein [Phytophthora infestans T30-4]|eukprot:XP_002907009.1 conserved hypothetical protein [Phytophthora infestans T30-4]